MKTGKISFAALLLSLGLVSANAQSAAAILPSGSELNLMATTTFNPPAGEGEFFADFIVTTKDLTDCRLVVTLSSRSGRIYDEGHARLICSGTKPSAVLTGQLVSNRLIGMQAGDNAKFLLTKSVSLPTVGGEAK